MSDQQELWSEKRVKTPSVLQMEAVECGAASLAMILAYYGRIVSLEELRSECGVSRDGSKASNVLKAARKYGLEAKGFKKELDSLYGVNLPAIIFWNFNHFVVFEGIKKGKAYLNDPAKGPSVVPMEEFDQSFTGVVLTFTLGPEFEKGGVRQSIFTSLKNRLAGCRSILTFIVVSCLMLVVPGLVVPTFTKLFVDNILVARMTGWFKPLLIGMVVMLVMRAALVWLQQYYLLRLQTKLALSGSVKFFRHVFRLPIEFFSQRMSGDIAMRVSLNDKVASLLSGELATNVLNLLMIIFFVLVMFKYDVVLTLISLGMAAINVIALKLVSSKRKVLNERLQQELGKLMGVSTSGLQMIETLKATGAESDFYSQWSGQHAKVVNAQQELAVPSQLLSVVPLVLMSLDNTAILTVGGLRVMNGDMTMGMLVAFQALMMSFMGPINQMVNLGAKLQETDADMKRLDDVFNYEVDTRFQEKDLTGAEKLEGMVKLTGAVEIKNLAFGYSKLEPPLIQDFNLVLRPGSRVALVGGSGSGKSTVAKVVAGLYKAWDGEVLLDGVARDKVPVDLLNNSIAMVDQDVFMFEGSIRDNLTIWDKTIPDTEVVRAAKDACIHDDIAGRPGGYSSMVEEGGANFSGGQRQRMEIARALVSNPTILILDEATSALDPNTEKIVDDNLRRRGCTCIIIAHRLSTIRDADEIIVLERGKVVQRGKHEELMKEEAYYAELINTQ